MKTVSQFIQATNLNRGASKSAVDNLLTIHNIKNDDLIADIYSFLGVDGEEVEVSTVRVFFKELNEYKYITLRFFDRYLHAGLITHTNHFGWFCM